MFENLFRRKPTDLGAVNTPDPVNVHNIPVSGGYNFSKPKDKLAMKVGKWVTVEGRIGVVTELSLNKAKVMYVTTPEGTNLAEETVHSGMLQIAKYKEIPAARREHLSPQAAAEFGHN